MDKKRYVVMRDNLNDFVCVVGIYSTLEKALGNAFLYVDDNEQNYEISRLSRTEGDTGWVFSVKADDMKYSMLILEGEECD